MWLLIMSVYNSKTDNTEPNPNAQKYSRPATTLYDADFSSAMPKIVQGAAYLTLNKVLTVSIFLNLTQVTIELLILLMIRRMKILLSSLKILVKLLLNTRILIKEKVLN